MLNAKTEGKLTDKPMCAKILDAKTIISALRNEGVAPANHTKNNATKLTRVRAILIPPIFFPKLDAIRLTKDKCMPDKAKICASPVRLKSKAICVDKKAFSPLVSANKKPPASFHSYNSRISLRRNTARI